MQTNKRQLILQAATRLFTSQGFRKTSVDEIASLAKVSKATIYQYFADKSELLGEVYKSRALALKEKMAQAIVPGTKTVTQLLHMLDLAREFYSNDPLLIKFLDRRELDEIEAVPQFNDIMSDAISLIGDLLTEGIKRGEIRPMPIKMASYFCFRIGFYLMQHGRELFTEFPPEEVMALFNSVISGGIAAGGSRS
jgi:TetR/AcrR family transcriptional regulator of autoinduction and epiphytic fitness